MNEMIKRVAKAIVRNQNIAEDEWPDYTPIAKAAIAAMKNCTDEALPNQSRRMSAIETTVNTVVGFIISWLVVLYVFPLWTWPPRAMDGFWMVAVMTVISWTRIYLIRRAFT